MKASFFLRFLITGTGVKQNLLKLGGTLKSATVRTLEIKKNENYNQIQEFIACNSFVVYSLYSVFHPSAFYNFCCNALIVTIVVSVFFIIREVFFTLRVLLIQAILSKKCCKNPL